MLEPEQHEAELARPMSCFPYTNRPLKEAFNLLDEAAVRGEGQDRPSYSSVWERHRLKPGSGNPFLGFRLSGGGWQPAGRGLSRSGLANPRCAKAGGAGAAKSNSFEQSSSIDIQRVYFGCAACRAVDVNGHKTTS